jgi:DNA polymerase-3 subunit alpha
MRFELFAHSEEKYVMNFSHLHVHTEYSLLDGACRIRELCTRAKVLGMKSLAITDHGTMYGVVSFVEACEANGLHPVIGCEVYVARDSRFDKTKGTLDKPYHLVLLAKTQEGYKNLLRIVSKGFLEGFYYKPRIDLEVLSEHSGGLIALTACLEGEIPSHLAQGKFEEARESLMSYADIFGKGNVYLEIQRNGVSGQEEINREIVRLARNTGVPLVATNDCHYLTREDAKYHDVLLAIQTGTNLNDPKRLRFQGDQFYFRSGEEMSEIFHDLPEAIVNTEIIADRCQVRLDFDSIHLPEFPLPSGQEPSGVLRQMSLEGLAFRFGSDPDPSVAERLQYELTMIDRMGYSSYFLIVSDFVNYAKSRGIAVGPGRGSAAGSLVAYCLGITDIDPLEHDLVFERFLNPERITMPDIDIDFQDDRRDEVIAYVKEKYGQDRVAQIITFGTLAARAAVRDVGRAMAFPYGDVDTIAKMIPNQIGMSIEKALEMVPALRDMREKENVRVLLDAALHLEGMPRHSSTHAAGIVIGKGPLWDYVPLAKGQDGGVVTQYPMEDLESLGLLKIDFLGLRTLTVLQRATSMIRARADGAVADQEPDAENDNNDEAFDLSRIPPNDPKTYDMLSEGESIGVFQLESSWVRDFLKELKPRELKDIIATVALCRPGPMEQIPEFLRSRNGTPRYLHPVLEPVLRETHGVLVYQEQILKIAEAVAGFTLGEADILRRAVGKKKKDLLEDMEGRFLKGALAKGISQDVARKIYDLILKFANYGFNKNHAAPYALIAYQTAYLKANYPKEFMAALLSSVMGVQGKVGVYLDEAKRLGLGVLGPSVNYSEVEFSVEGEAIRFGLASIKNVGAHLAESLVSERKRNGPYRSLQDLASRIEGRLLTRKALETLIQCGACDDLGTRYDNLDGLDLALRQRVSKTENQLSLFGFEPQEGPTLFSEPPATSVRSAPALPEPSKEERIPLDVRLSWERDLLGMYFSGHPLEKYKTLLTKRTTPIPDLEYVPDGRDATVGGRVSSVKKVTTKQGEEMAFVSIEDEFATLEVIVFPKLWQRTRNLFVKENVVLVTGSVEEQEETRRILAREAVDAESVPDT